MKREKATCITRARIFDGEGVSGNQSVMIRCGALNLTRRFFMLKELAGAGHILFGFEK